MHLLDITLESVIENIALDEALLMYSEQTGKQYLRFWSPQQYAVVMGRSGKLEQETETEYCRHNQIPVYRRPSGGGTILTGPGCLMYAIILNSNLNPRLKEIQGCHDLVLGEMKKALHRINIPCDILGISDLAIGDLKFSGNSLRLKRDSILYHGTLLCEFDLDQISYTLRSPVKQPDYRQNRPHAEFVTNLNHPESGVRSAIVDHWNPEDQESEITPQIKSFHDELMAEKYQDANWNVLS